MLAVNSPFSASQDNRIVPSPQRVDCCAADGVLGVVDPRLSIRSTVHTTEAGRVYE